MKTWVKLVLICFLFSCGNAGESNSEPAADAVEATSKQSDAMVSESASEGLAGNSDLKSFAITDSVAAVPSDETKTETPQTPSKTSAQEPLLIKTGYLSIEAEDYKAYRNTVEALVKKHGGYLGNESEVNETYRITNDLVIRVPAVAFDKMMNGLMEKGLKTDSKRVEVQDVGEEYADLQARIATKKAIEKRYIDILNKASKISDILEVEEKLRVIREETEAAQGRVKYLSNQVTYSTIYLNFYKVLDTHYTPPSGPNFISKVWKGIARGWEGIQAFIIGLFYLWPLWVLLILLIYIIRKRKGKWNFRIFKRSEPENKG